MIETAFVPSRFKVVCVGVESTISCDALRTRSDGIRLLLWWLMHLMPLFQLTGAGESEYEWNEYTDMEQIRACYITTDVHILLSIRGRERRYRHGHDMPVEWWYAFQNWK